MKAHRESDSLIVLGAGESPVHTCEMPRQSRNGEGVDKHTQFSEKTSGGAGRPKQLMPIFLRGITGKARRDKKHRFKSLYSLFNPANLKSSYLGLNKKAVAGVDKVDYHTYGKDIDSNIAELVEDLKAKRYRAKLVRRAYIPKGGGKLRALGIPAISDKVLQSTGAQILSGIYEQDFMPYSYGYRPGKSTRHAIGELRHNLSKYCTWVVEADIRGFFDNIDHDWMMRMLEERVNDKAFLRLIKKWLKAGILDLDKHVINPATGSPQGGIISPVLANIYLHYSLDLWFEKVVKPSCRGYAFLVRYADDFVVGFQYHGDAQWFYRELPKRLGKFKLSLAEEKTRVMLFSRFRKRDSERLDFLGFEFRWGRSRQGKNIIKQRTSTSKFRKALTTFKEWCKEVKNKRLRWIFPKVNAKLRGYYGYYGVTFNGKRLKAFYEKVKWYLYHNLNRRSERRSFNWKTFEEIVRYYRLARPKIVWGWKRQQCLNLA